MRNGDQFDDSGLEARIIGVAGNIRKIDAVPRKDVLRQPTGAAAAVLPDVLEDIRHLQTLRKRGSERAQTVAAAGYFGRIIAEQVREHLAHDPGDVVAIVVQIARTGQPFDAGIELEARHPVAHELYAALD